MWAPISLNSALRKHLNGKQVKLVDLQRDMCRNLSEVLKDFADGVMFYANTSAAENPDFREAVEDMTAADQLQGRIDSLNREKDELKRKLDAMTEEYANLSVAYAELKARIPAGMAGEEKVSRPGSAAEPEKDPTPEKATESAASAVTDRISEDEPEDQEAIDRIAARPKRRGRRRTVGSGKGTLTVEQDEAKRRARPIDDIGKLRALFHAGWSFTKIASEFNVTEETVEKTLAREKIT